MVAGSGAAPTGFGPGCGIGLGLKYLHHQLQENLRQREHQAVGLWLCPAVSSSLGFTKGEVGVTAAGKRVASRRPSRNAMQAFIVLLGTLKSI